MIKLSTDLLFISSVLDEQRFAGLDQNPKGVRDLLYACARRAEELEKKVEELESNRGTET